MRIDVVVLSILFVVGAAPSTLAVTTTPHAIDLETRDATWTEHALLDSCVSHWPTDDVSPLVFVHNDDVFFERKDGFIEPWSDLRRDIDLYAEPDDSFFIRGGRLAGGTPWFWSDDRIAATVGDCAYAGVDDGLVGENDGADGEYGSLAGLLSEIRTLFGEETDEGETDDGDSKFEPTIAAKNISTEIPRVTVFGGSGGGGFGGGGSTGGGGGGGGGGGDGFAPPPSVVPLPAGAWLLLSALAVLSAARRARRA